MPSKEELVRSYNFVIDEINKGFAEARAHWLSESPASKESEHVTAPKTGSEEGKKWESNHELVRRENGKALTIVYDAIEAIVKKVNPEFSIEHLPKDKQKILADLIIKTVNQLGKEQEKSKQPFAELSQRTISTGIQAFLGDIARFFRSITGMQKPAQLFDEAAKYAVKEAGRTIAQSAKLAAQANAGKYRPPVKPQDKGAHRD
jgi:hypothetical protein